MHNKRETLALVLDMDGVIIDSEPLHKEVEQEMFAELGFKLSHEEHVKYAGVGKEMWETLKKDFGCKTDKSAEELHSEKRDRYLKRLKSKPIEPIEGIVELVAECKRCGIKVAIASSSSRYNINLVAKAVGIASSIDTIVSGDEVPRTKPFPDIFIQASKQLGIEASHCVVIEDSSNGAHAAKDASMYCIGFVNPHSGNQDLSVADVTIDKITDAEPIICSATAAK